MSSPLQQFPFLSSLITPSPDLSPNSRPFQSKTLKAFPFRASKVSSSSSDPSSAESSSSSSFPDTAENQVDAKSERIKLVFDRAKEYKKKSLESNSVQKDSELQSSGIIGSNRSRNDGSILAEGEGEEKEVPEAVWMAMERAREYKNKGMVDGGGSATGEKENSKGDDNGKKEIPVALRIAMEKAKEYKKNKGMDAGSGTVKKGYDNQKKEIPEALGIAMDKAKEYKKNKGMAGGSGSLEKSEKLPGPKTGIGNEMRNENLKDKASLKKELKISSVDFMGLDFSGKKNQRGLPPGLVPVADPYAYGEMPEVEILVGDASKFGNLPSADPKDPSEDTSDLYKPKVSTWGVFPRPSNISKTFGGGRNLRPGEALETPEDKAAKEARTRKLVAEYKAKIGLNIDPKLKAECEKELKEGDALMDAGKLKEALPYYQKVMDKLVFQSELHGLAALQWSICHDSLSRPDVAQAMYKKLQSHPNAQVSKKARQFVFSFEAMEMMKVRRAAPINPGYQPYFEAFVDEKANYSQESVEEEEGSFFQALPYLVFLASPIVLVLLIAVNKAI